MPTYQYACTECGHSFEQVQSFSDDALTVCPQCEGRLRKVYNAVGVVFKGSGFYRNDSRPTETSGASGDSSSGESGGSDKGGSDKGGSDKGSSDTSGSGKSGSDKSDSGGSDKGGSEKKPSSDKPTPAKAAAPSKSSSS